jgi:hypothetical protein
MVMDGYLNWRNGFSCSNLPDSLSGGGVPQICVRVADYSFNHPHGLNLNAISDSCRPTPEVHPVGSA